MLAIRQRLHDSTYRNIKSSPILEAESRMGIDKDWGRGNRELLSKDSVSVLTAVHAALTTLWKSESLSRVRLSATPWTAAHQAPRSMELCRQEYWSG